MSIAPRQRTARCWPHAFGVVVLMCALVACTSPAIPPPPPEAEEEEDDTLSSVPDPAHDELVALLEQFSTTVERAQTEIDAAAEAERPTETRQRATAALAALLDDPETTATDDRALFPAVSAERSISGDEDDLLNSTLSLAREVGGPLGRDVVEMLREPVAGDLGAWERDAEGVIGELEELVAGITSVEEATETIPGVAGDGTRALAWTMLASTSTDPELAATAAQWASGHLGVVTVALSLLDPDRAATPPPSDGPAESDETETDGAGAGEADPTAGVTHETGVTHGTAAKATHKTAAEATHETAAEATHETADGATHETAAGISGEALTGGRGGEEAGGPVPAAGAEAATAVAALLRTSLIGNNR